MTVKVHNIYTNKTETFSGSSDSIKNQIGSKYNFLDRYHHESFEDLIHELSRCQSFFVEVEG
jgi:hypothetical protein